MAKRKQRGRPINGILLLNKPYGISSNKALQEIKNIYFARKAGHTGSLDPLATGMLPICFGEATKFSQFLLDADKTYQVTAQFGVRTETCDKEGDVVATCDVQNLSVQNVEAVLPQFRGNISQIPTMFSALKYQGQPLYKLARQGIEVERQPRAITIYNLTLDEFDTALKTAKFTVKCSKGTYIRNLIDDIGQALNVGAHVTQLHRLDVASFSAEQMLGLEVLEELRSEKAFQQLDDLILPLELLAENFPTIHLDKIEALKLRQGESVNIAAQTDSIFSVFSEQQFIGIAEINADGLLHAKRLIAE